MSRTRGRLAPTPSGHLHLGNALAFGAAALSVRPTGGRLVLRIEDLDRGRARHEIAQAQREDLAWLGIEWDEEVTPQSARKYDVSALPTFRCTCSRKARLARACRCRESPPEEGAIRFAGPRRPVAFEDLRRGPQSFIPDEDPVLVRADGEPAYPLAVVLDDLRDGVTEVVRGADLLEATAVQVALYEALGKATPTWCHIPMLLGPDGRKLSKSHGSTELAALRQQGWSPDDVWALLLPLLGQPDVSFQEAGWDPARVALGPFVLTDDLELEPLATWATRT